MINSHCNTNFLLSQKFKNCEKAFTLLLNESLIDIFQCPVYLFTSKVQLVIFYN